MDNLSINSSGKKWSCRKSIDVGEGSLWRGDRYGRFYCVLSIQKCHVFVTFMVVYRYCLYMH